MRGEHDLYQPKDGAECEHLEFKCHGYPDADCDRTRYHRLEPTAQSADSSEGAAGHLHPHHLVVDGLGTGLQPDQRARHPLDEAFEVDLVAQAIRRHRPCNACPLQLFNFRRCTEWPRFVPQRSDRLGNRMNAITKGPSRAKLLSSSWSTRY